MSDSEDNNVNSNDIDEVLTKIDRDRRAIRNLFKQKNESLQKLEIALDLRRYAKVNLQADQINFYANFMNFLKIQWISVKSELQKINSKKDLSHVKKQLLHSNTDYAFVYNELYTINTFQNNVISLLNNIITKANAVLNAL